MGLDTPFETWLFIVLVNILMEVVKGRLDYLKISNEDAFQYCNVELLV